MFDISSFDLDFRPSLNPSDNETRTDRRLAINRAPRITSSVYPELEAFYQTVGRHFIQTGELALLEERP